MRVLAFYLPQFHPIPENDAWWGKGFTEWTNVAAAKPLFPGHYQPRLPADLGFYDLRLADVLEAQADLARDHGIHGFCYHYYFFKNGRRLLERPLERMLASGTPDFPFCLCWANENWTRRWDGRESEVLVAQEHDAQNDLAFLRSVLPYFRDRRYIRIDGRPVLVVYRTSLFPDVAGTVERWRAEAARHGEAAPYLIAAESLDPSHDAALRSGFDATCEFPPHGAAKAVVPRKAWPQSLQGFSGTLLDYRRMVDFFLTRPPVAYRRFRSVTLDWDNTARRGSSASLMVNFSLADYHRWLATAIAETREPSPHDEQLVFINAWNEWGEGTYLEPDQLRGRACLEATREAILGRAPTSTAMPTIGLGTPQPSALPPPPAHPPPSAGASQGKLRLVGVAMIGNEADIVEAFVRENCRYVDHLLIAEHNALDGTAEILAALAHEGLPITVTKLSNRAYEQTKVTNQLLDAALARFSPDWIIPLDADEFIDAGDRNELESRLASCHSSHVLVPWLNHGPSPFDDVDEVHPLRRIRQRYSFKPPKPNENPWVWKLMLNCALYGPYLDRYELEKGSHRIVFRGTKDPSKQPAVTMDRIGLRHYPVRSYDQLALKVGIGEIQKGSSSTGREQAGFHWAPMLRGLLGGGHDIDLLQSACREYLDTGRLTAEQTAEVPLITDPFPAHGDLTLSRFRLPAAGVLIRWLHLQQKA